MQVNELTKLDLSYNEVQQLPEQLWEGVAALNTLLLRYVYVCSWCEYTQENFPVDCPMIGMCHGIILYALQGVNSAMSHVQLRTFYQQS